MTTTTTTTNNNESGEVDAAYMDSVIKRLYEIHKRGSEVISDYYATQKKKINSTN